MRPTFDPSTAKPADLGYRLPICPVCRTQNKLVTAINPRAGERQPFWICACNGGEG